MPKRSIDIVHPKMDPNDKESVTAAQVEQTEKQQKNAPQTVQEAAAAKESAARETPSINTADRSDDAEMKLPPPASQAAAPPVPRGVFWPAYLLGLLIIAVVVFFGVRAASSLVDVWTNLDPTTVESGETATEEESVVEETAETPPAAEESTGEAAESEPVAPSINKSSLSLRILNGNGVPGAAESAKTVLEAAGFAVASVGNAKQFTYDSTIVYYPANKSQEGELVAEALRGQYSVTTEENAVADGYDALIVIGKE